MLKACNMKIPQGSLTLIIDENGLYYRLPIAMLNDPEKYEVDVAKEKLEKKAKPSEVAMKLKIRSVKGDCTLDVTNCTEIVELKKSYIENVDKSLQLDQVKFFCMGKLLKDEHFVYTYDIKDEMVVQAMVKASAA